MGKVATGRIDDCKVVRVIRIEFLRGDGTSDDPCRIVKQWREFDGTLIYEHDHCAQPEVSK